MCVWCTQGEEEIISRPERAWSPSPPEKMTIIQNKHTVKPKKGSLLKNYARASRTKWVMCSGQMGLYKHPRSGLYLVDSSGKPKSILSLVLQRGRQW